MLPIVCNLVQSRYRMSQSALVMNLTKPFISFFWSRTNDPTLSPKHFHIILCPTVVFRPLLVLFTTRATTQGIWNGVQHSMAYSPFLLFDGFSINLCMAWLVCIFLAQQINPLFHCPHLWLEPLHLLHYFLRILMLNLNQIWWKSTLMELAMAISVTVSNFLLLWWLNTAMIEGVPGKKQHFLPPNSSEVPLWWSLSSVALLGSLFSINTALFRTHHWLDPYIAIPYCWQPFDLFVVDIM